VPSAGEQKRPIGGARRFRASRGGGLTGFIIRKRLARGQTCEGDATSQNHPATYCRHHRRCLPRPSARFHQGTRRIFSAARGAGRDHLGLFIGHRDRLAGIRSECDPDLPTISTSQMLPSGWITRWSNQGRCREIIPCNRRQDFCCAGKIELFRSIILTMRDAKIVIKKATCGATEMVIAVRP
jgi:hypothetical protein